MPKVKLSDIDWVAYMICLIEVECAAIGGGIMEGASAKKIALLAAGAFFFMTRNFFRDFRKKIEGGSNEQKD